MFVGHYAAALALKRSKPEASLGFLFIAVQLVDIIFFPSVLWGIEKLTIVKNYTAATHFKLDFMPYTHSLTAAFVWAGLTYLLFRFLPLFKSVNRNIIAIVMALAVLSHWFLDLIVHTPDLPLWIGDSPTIVGLGLWQSAGGTYAAEAFLLIIGLGLYMTSTKATCSAGKYGMPVFVLVLLVFNGLNIFAPPIYDTTLFLSISSLLVYFFAAASGFWLDKKRV